MLRNIRLSEKDGLLRVKTASKKVNRDLPRVFPPQLSIVKGGHGMVIRDKVIGLAFILKLDRRLHHTKVVSNVQNA